MFYPVPGKDDIFGENLSTSSTFARERSSIGKSSYCVRALSYCDLHKVMFADLQEILDMYPEFAGDFLAKFRVTFDLREVNRHCITKSENVLKQGAKDLIQSNRYGGSLNIHAQYTHTLRQNAYAYFTSTGFHSLWKKYSVISVSGWEDCQEWRKYSLNIEPPVGLNDNTFETKS